jgi:undecaprenyl-diphosphatase
MEALDFAVIGWLNSFSQVNPTFDEVVYLIARNDLLKGGVLIALLWWVWMRQNSRIITSELLAVRSIAGALVAIVVGRVLQNMLPGSKIPSFYTLLCLANSSAWGRHVLESPSPS